MTTYKKKDKLDHMPSNTSCRKYTYLQKHEKTLAETISVILNIRSSLFNELTIAYMHNDKDKSVRRKANLNEGGVCIRVLSI